MGRCSPTRQMAPPCREGCPVWVRALVAVNAVAGVALWFFAAGRYSFVGSLPDLLFGPIVGVIALTTVSVLRVSGVRVNQPGVLLPLLPAILGGGLAILLAIFRWIPPSRLLQCSSSMRLPMSVRFSGSREELAKDVSPDQPSSGGLL